MDIERTSSTETISINAELARLIQEELGQNVYLCYQCVKCTSGCPLGEYFDWQPNQIMRALQLGQEDIALHSQTPWLCASCQTCSTRCPQGLDITAIMEYLTRLALKRGFKPPVPQSDAFNKAFMREVRLWGRMYEPGLMAEMKMRNPQKLFEDVDFYMRMLAKRKVAFFPEPTRPARPARPVAGAASAVAYYPGCSLHSTATEFNTSAKAACEALEINLIEPKGWICCGSSAAHRSDPQAALRLPMENLVLVEQGGFKEVTMPCAACFNRHKAAQYEIRQHPQRKKKVDDELGYVYNDSLRVTTMVESILEHAGVEKIARRTQKPLNGLRLVCYYGCLLTRPPQATESKHHENPTDIDQVMRALGAEVLDWSYKTSCCGAVHSLVRPEIAIKLSGNLIQQAQKAGAEAVVVACPLCHTNLDARQFQMKLDSATPVLYFSQLMVLAFGLPEKSAALHKNLIDPRPLLRSKGIIKNAAGR